MSCLRPLQGWRSPNRFSGLARRATFRRSRGGLRTAEHLDSLWEDCEDRTTARNETKASRGWLTYLYEPLATRMAGYIVSFAVVAGFSTGLGLLVFGVNEQPWSEQAKAAGQ